MKIAVSLRKIVVMIQAGYLLPFARSNVYRAIRMYFNSSFVSRRIRISPVETYLATILRL
jgi:hypothetical protein